MQAFGFNQFGGPDVFETLERPMPIPKANQVLIKVMAFGINVYDATLRAGSQKDSRPLPFPIIPGSDVVGTIAKVGSDVSDYQVGDWVINLRPLRGYSEYVTASTGKIVQKPQTMSVLTAASLPTPGVTAYNITHEFLRLQKDKTIAVIGASGTVGSIVVQIAKSMGLHVLGIGAAKNAQFMQLIGVDELSFYDQEDVGEKFRNRADYVVNAALFGHDDGITAKIVKAGTGAIATVADQAPQITKSGVKVTYVHTDRNFSTKKALEFLTNLARTWGLTIRADALPFNQNGIVTGHQKLENHTNIGHLVVVRSTNRTINRGVPAVN